MKKKNLFPQYVERRTAIVVMIGILLVGFFVSMSGSWRALSNPQEGAWEIAFLLPDEPGNFDFSLTNHQNISEFTYEVFRGRESIQKNTITVPFGERITVDLDEKDIFSRGEGVYTLRVRDKNAQEREIYRRR